MPCPYRREDGEFGVVCKVDDRPVPVDEWENCLNENVYAHCPTKRKADRWKEKGFRRVATVSDHAKSGMGK